jgi:hypothetical protein
MKITADSIRGRSGWTLDNDRLSVVLLAGGGHIAGLRLHSKPTVNPLWAPIWKGMEPWAFRPADRARYESALLAAIRGHNLCLGYFGGASPDEEKAGLGGHGEAPVLRWRLLRKRVQRSGLCLAYGCELPVAQMRIRRTVSLRRGSNIVNVEEQVESLARRDLPYTMCEHVTFGPPFLEKGCTVFDMPATRGHTFPRPFGRPQRLKTDAAFTWPRGPAADGGTVDLRRLDGARPRNSDFSTQLIAPGRETAWFSAVNPKLGLLVAYVWRRADFPWVGNWEENHARRIGPWAGRSLTRGMEFANTPFPVSLRESVDRGRFHATPTFAWLPARGRVTIAYRIVVQEVPVGCRGVRDIQPKGAGFEIALLV